MPISFIRQRLPLVMVPGGIHPHGFGGKNPFFKQVLIYRPDVFHRCPVGIVHHGKGKGFPLGPFDFICHIYPPNHTL